VERVEWVNSIIKALWPHLGQYADHLLRTQVAPEARAALETYRLYGFKFHRVDLGRIAPRVGGIRVHRSPNDDEIVLDADVEYAGDAALDIGLMRVSAGVRDVQVEGKVRVVLKPLIDSIPLVGGVQVKAIEVIHYMT